MLHFEDETSFSLFHQLMIMPKKKKPSPTQKKMVKKKKNTKEDKIKEEKRKVSRHDNLCLPT